MADQTSEAVELGQTQVAPSHSNNRAEQHAAGGPIAQALGTLGLLEVYGFIVFVLGGPVLTGFEGAVLNNLALFEGLGRIPGILAACLMINSSSDVDEPENVKTMTRDQLHNMVYPRSPPRSRTRRDFAAMAWYSLWIASVPIVLLLTFFPVWSLSSEDEVLWVRLVPSILAVLAIIVCVAGFVVMDWNQSCFVLTVMYTMTKIISLFVFLYDADSLLFEEGTITHFIGIPLVCLQFIKVGSGCVAAVKYVKGRPDENLPQLHGAFRLCCFACSA